MRSLLVLGLILGLATPAVAQTEVIIRRPGEKDQVLRVDSAQMAESLAKVQAQLHGLAEGMRAKMATAEVGALRAHIDTVVRAATIAMRSSGEAAMVARSGVAAVTRKLAAMRRQTIIGVTLDYGPRDTDKYGAYVNGVTPGGPAERAGIVARDIITRIAGKSVACDGRSTQDGECLPGMRLSEAIAELTPNKQVEVELRRGTQTRTVKVTPVESSTMAIAERAPTAWTQLTPMPSTGRIAMGQAMPEIKEFSFSGDGNQFGVAFLANGLFANIELAPLNEKLGSYFGTTEGVLVVNTEAGRDGAMVGGVNLRESTRAPNRVQLRARADSSNRVEFRARTDTTIDGSGVAAGRMMLRNVPSRATTLGLEPGDVIVSVDGRKVTTVSQLMRIVGTYDRGEEFKLQIMRQKHAETLTVKMP